MTRHSVRQSVLVCAGAAAMLGFGASGFGGVTASVQQYSLDASNISPADYSPGWIVRQAPLPMLAPTGTAGPAADPTNERARFNENNFGTNFIAGQTFTAPQNFDMVMAQLAVSGDNGFVYGLSLHALTGPLADPNTITAASYGPNLFGDANLQFTFTGSANPSILSLVFSDNSGGGGFDDVVSLTSGTQYLWRMTRLTAVGGQPNMTWYRDANPGDTHAGGTAGDNYRSTNATDMASIQGGTGRRDFALALFNDIPEPASMGVLGLAALGLVARRRRRA